jgi:hypothetical protein
VNGCALARERRAKECAALTIPKSADRQTRVLHQSLIRLGQRIAALAATAADLETQITQIVEEMAPGLVAAEPGLGALSAAHRLNRLGDRQLNRAIHVIAVTGCAATRPPSPTSSADAPKAKPTRKSAAASSATSPATSTGFSATLDKHRRSVMKPAPSR